MAIEMKKMFEKMASTAKDALMPVAFAAAATAGIASTAQAQAEEPVNPFKPGDADIAFQPSLIGTLISNRVNLRPSLAQTQFSFGNDAFLSGGFGIHAKIEESVEKRLELGYEFAKGRHFGFVGMPLKQKNFVQTKSHVNLALDGFIWGMSNPEGSGTYGVGFEPGVKTRMYVSDRIGLEASFKVRAMAGFGGGEPLLHFGPQAGIGIVVVPKR